VTWNRDQKSKQSLRRRLRSLATVMAIGLSMSLSGANRPDSRRLAARRKTQRRIIALSVPVNGSRAQSDLSPELLHDLPDDANGPTPNEVTPQSASAVALEPVPFLRGLYTGAARTFTQSNGKLRVTWLEVTAYCPCTKCCGPEANGVTASGKPVSYNGGAFAAADADEFPFGAKLRVPGYHEGRTIEVIDRGSAIRHAKVDVYFPTHEQAEAWGRQWIPVIVEQ
jgi:3D (Asp-Asp-Asp) domain-containing protein